MKIKFILIKVKVLSLLFFLANLAGGVTKVFAKKNKSVEIKDGDILCNNVGDTLNVLAKMNACDYQESDIPTIELLTTSFQGDRFGDGSEKWPKWTMDVNTDPPAPVKSGLVSNLLIREESFGGILINKDKDHAFRLNARAYYVIKMLHSGRSPKEVFCNEKEHKDFYKQLKKVGILNEK